jgi:putative transposase
MTNPDSSLHRRRSIRLPDYDYTTPGAYFVTLCTQEKRCLFGDVVAGQMQLNKAGIIVMQCWREIPEHFPYVELDEFVVMPNHVHGILVFHENCRGIACYAPTAAGFGKMVSGSLPTVIRSFKSAVTRGINKMRRTPSLPVWQRSFYEHVIRKKEDLAVIREYIANNALRWEFDLDKLENTPSDF